MGLFGEFVVLDHFSHVVDGFLFFGEGLGKAHVIVGFIMGINRFGGNFGGADGLLQVSFFCVIDRWEEVDLGLEELDLGVNGEENFFIQLIFSRLFRKLVIYLAEELEKELFSGGSFQVRDN